MLYPIPWMGKLLWILNGKFENECGETWKVHFLDECFHTITCLYLFSFIILDKKSKPLTHGSWIGGSLPWLDSSYTIILIKIAFRHAYHKVTVHEIHSTDKSNEIEMRFLCWNLAHLDIVYCSTATCTMCNVHFRN